MVEMYNVTISPEKLGISLKNLNIHWWYDPAIAILGIYHREMETYVHTKICKWQLVSSCICNIPQIVNNQNAPYKWMIKQIVYP